MMGPIAWMRWLRMRRWIRQYAATLVGMALAQSAVSLDANTVRK